MTPPTAQLRLPLDAAGPLCPSMVSILDGRLPDGGERAAPAPPGDAAAHPVAYQRSPRARRYILRVRDDGSVRVTIPRGGSAREAEAFYLRQAGWIARQRERLKSRLGDRARDESLGGHVWVRGVRAALVRIDGPPLALRFADQTVPMPAPDASPRTVLAAHFRSLATLELPARLMTLASGLGLLVSRVTVRDQRSRWGSCSPRGAISLNWRLLQMPDEVQDYVMLHELMHLRRLDHSRAFWRLVRNVCPGFREARLWLRRHGRELL